MNAEVRVWRRHNDCVHCVEKDANNLFSWRTYICILLELNFQCARVVSQLLLYTFTILIHLAIILSVHT